METEESHKIKEIRNTCPGFWNIVQENKDDQNSRRLQEENSNE